MKIGENCLFGGCLCLLLSRWAALDAPMLFDALQCRLVMHLSARLP